MKRALPLLLLVGGALALAIHLYDVIYAGREVVAFHLKGGEVFNRSGPFQLSPEMSDLRVKSGFFGSPSFEYKVELTDSAGKTVWTRSGSGTNRKGRKNSRAGYGTVHYPFSISESGPHYIQMVRQTFFNEGPLRLADPEEVWITITAHAEKASLVLIGATSLIFLSGLYQLLRR